MERTKCLKEQNVECLFRICYIIHLLLSFNAVINRTYIVKVSLGITLLLGVYVGVVKLWYWRELVYHKNFFLLNLFIISFVVSSIVNYKYGIIGNLKGFVWLCIQIWLLYLWVDGENIYKEVKYIGNIFIIIVSIENIVNFILFFIGFSYRKVTEYGDIQMLGFHWSRMWGIYDDPNHGAVISVLAIAFALYFYHVNCKKRKWYMISMVFQTLYIYWSDSRTGIYSLALLVLIWGIILCINKYKSCVRKKIRRCFFTIGITLLVVVLVSPIQSISGQIRNNTKLIYEKKCFKEQSEVIETVGRDDNTSDPSNRRFSIWKSGVEIWNTKPVFGVSWANLTNYAEKEVPNTYIVNNDLQNFSSLHNMVLDVLVGQGIIGIVLLGCININTLAFIIKNYKKLCGVNELLGGFFFTIMCISFFTSLFISSIFYINSPESYTFWFVFGGYMSILQKNYKQEDENNE